MLRQWLRGRGRSQAIGIGVMVLIVIAVFAIGDRLRTTPSVPDGPPETRVSGYGPPKAIGDPAAWISLTPGRDARPGSYQLEARLVVGVNGRVTECTLQGPSGDRVVDATACLQLFARGRYSPARDVKGKPVTAVEYYRLGWTVRPPSVAPPPERPVERAIVCPKSTVTGPMVAEPCMADDWIADGAYPPGPLARGESGLVRYRLDVDPTGRVARCHIEQSSGHRGLDGDTCALISRRARFVPAQDVDGSPMEWEYRGSVQWQLARR